MNPTRREFLQTAASGSTLLTFGFGLPPFLAPQVWADEKGRTGAAGRTLVVLQLSGGNDGLSTVVPFRSDAYYRFRPTLGIPAARVHRLDSEFGLHPQLRGFKELHDDGMLAIVHGVGYPNPDRSHFRSMEIWHTARPDREKEVYGWLGRYLDSLGPRSRSRIPGVHVGRRVPLVLRAGRTSVPAIPDPRRFTFPAALGGVAQRDLLVGRRASRGNEALEFLRRSVRSAVLDAEEMARRAASYRTPVHYPATGVGQGFKHIAQMMSAGLGIRVFYLSLGGFDTHAGQAPGHDQLMKWTGEAVRAYFQDMKSRRMEKEVLLMVFSEFGRRVKENGSRGTDHGAAAPMFLVSGSVRGGLHGAHPSLSALEEGDLRHTVDFRSVYATVLEDWMGADAGRVLGRKFAKLNLVRA